MYEKEDNTVVNNKNVSVDLKNVNLSSIVDLINNLDIEKFKYLLSTLNKDNKSNAVIQACSSYHESDNRNAGYEEKSVSNKNYSIDKDLNYNNFSKALESSDNSGEGQGKVNNHDKSSDRNKNNEKGIKSEDKPTGEVKSHVRYKEDGAQSNINTNTDESYRESQIIFAQPKKKDSVTKSTYVDKPRLDKTSIKESDDDSQLFNRRATNGPEARESIVSNTRSNLKSRGININFDKGIEILNAIKPMLDYDRYLLIDNIIKFCSIGKTLERK